MIEDFKRRFWASLALTVPILALSPMIQEFLGLGEAWRFAGDTALLFVLSTAVFVYGGWPFLRGGWDELAARRPGMMLLIAVATVTAYAYSTAVVFGLTGKLFYWELATLVDIMLLGHWIEMRSVMGASKALEALARLMPAEASVIQPDGTTRAVSLAALQPGDRILIKPGEKVPADGRVVEGESEVNEAMVTGESKPVATARGR